MEEDPELRIDSVHLSTFDQLIKVSEENVTQYGSKQQKALMAFMRFEQLSYHNNTDIYSKALVANDLMKYHDQLPADVRSKAYDRLAYFYLATRQLDMLLTVSLEKCHFLHGDSVENCLELSGVYHNLKHFDKAIEIYYLCIQESERKNDPFMMGAYFNNIGIAHLEMKRPDSAKRAYREALNIFDTISHLGGFEPEYVQHFKNVVQWNILGLGGDDITPEQTELAKKLVRSGLKFVEPNWVMNGYEIQAKNHFHKKEFELANSYVDSAIATARTSHSSEREVNLLQFKGKILIAKGQLRYGEDIFGLAKNISDSLDQVNADLKANIAAAAFKDKARESQLARTQERAEEERQQRITTTVLLAAALVILLLLVIFYYQSRKSAKLIAKQRAELAGSLAEKEVLLKEIHHRVKNNLQVVSNMLDLGTFTETDPKLLATLAEARDRIKTMALIHTNLYQHDDLSAIKFEGYLNDLLRGLADSYFDRKKKISWKLNAGQDLLDIDTAVPVGLIVNELVSNAFKYAFLEKEEGVIEVDFKKENDSFRLIVKDDGRGLPEDFDPANSKSLGLRIVLILVRQLEGEMNMFRDNGTQFHITFKPLEQRKIETR